MWIVSVPLRIQISKKKTWSLNLNQYRNTHFQTLNKAKVIFEKQVGPLLQGIPKLRTCTLEYVIYAPNRQLFDTDNLGAIINKFFADTLISLGIIEDDNYKILVGTHYRFGGIDRVNPRCDVIIRSPDFPSLVPPEPIESNSKMKIVTVSKSVVTLSDEDMKKALRLYLKDFMPISDDAVVTFNFTNEKTDEYIVTVETSAAQATTEKAPIKEPKERTTKPEPVPSAPTTENETTPPPALGRSLFANLKKPKND